MQTSSKSLIKTKKFLLDTSAIIALLKQESGYKILEDVIASSALSSVNLSELVSVLTRSNIKENEIDTIITDIVPDIIPFSESISIKAGKLISLTKDYGLSLGDRACIATGGYYNMEIYTTDRIWLKLSDKLPVKITLVR
ncbi:MULTISPECIES: type II toxin-antitoxin system VapC family toxin [unclassified Candidatus Tisiphia]|jgi:PIN domain nuclease of toxin-antitoxin system|uniref:type II toxin-antitoxin system VapC family toxin n=1 Tax=unclassified Candidatus Tisiphia TaxID=2996318 RepID=UPI001E70DC12|nr:MAG: type II toxin-antitoxin system VapC family toxin [Rickettsia endosymbiont of Cimex lectularius]